MSDPTPALDPGSALHGLKPFAWDTREAVSYEVAVEMLSQQIAAATTRLDDEQAKSTPDAQMISELEELTTRLTLARQNLRSKDQAEVATILATAQRDIRAIRAR